MSILFWDNNEYLCLLLFVNRQSSVIYYFFVWSGKEFQSTLKNEIQFRFISEFHEKLNHSLNLIGGKCISNKKFCSTFESNRSVLKVKMKWNSLNRKLPFTVLWVKYFLCWILISEISYLSSHLCYAQFEMRCLETKFKVETNDENSILNLLYHKCVVFQYSCSCIFHELTIWLTVS